MRQIDERIRGLVRPLGIVNGDSQPPAVSMTAPGSVQMQQRSAATGVGKRLVSNYSTSLPVIVEWLSGTTAERACHP